MVLVLLSAAAVTLYGAHVTIVTRTYEATIRSGSTATVGPVGVTGNQTFETFHLQGTDAVWMGVGLGGLGIMFGGWAIAILPAMAPVLWNGAPKTVRRMLGIGLASLLLIAQIVCLLGVFPPWSIPARPSIAGFWIPMVIVAILAVAIVRKWIPRRHAPATAQIGLFLIIGQAFIPGSSVAGPVIAVFSVMFFAMHAMALHGLLTSGERLFDAFASAKADPTR